MQLNFWGTLSQRSLPASGFGGGGRVGGKQSGQRVGGLPSGHFSKFWSLLGSLFQGGTRIFRIPQKRTPLLRTGPLGL